MIFTGTGKVPDFTENKPAPWSSHMHEIQTVTAGGITEIGTNAFAGAEKLLRVETGANIERIGEAAFAGCTKLLFIDVAK